jgi:putative phosphoesterase
LTALLSANEITERFSQVGDLWVGVVADTHIPDQFEVIHPALLSALKAAQVQLILHAGDICLPYVLDQFNQIAPVIAVRGNRDFLFPGLELPMVQEFDLAGVRVGLTHGHISLVHYLIDKIRYLVHGYILESYLPALEKQCPQAKIVVFGHTHFPANVSRNGKIFFNPGPAITKRRYNIPPSYGLLHFSKGKVDGTIYLLTGAVEQRGKWKTI